MLADFIRRYENPARYCWAIVLKETGEVIGTVAAPTVPERTECVEVTYAVGSAWWGKGLAPEALKAVMDFLFDRVGVNRIEAGHDVRNPNSGRVMEKAGMLKEGVLRQAGRNNQGLFDLVFYAMLKQDR
ncbi:MAG: GNAT family N-acetyltransferase [Clostridia bacterium]|nr:GNAT family N-acetyltransferase [Clostridia bacterium]